ncbi:MAG TPA: S49 family peptidase [Geminicoccaceae bacterium]|nr:S49 family peptidase [Geminicoccus sp.]HMU52121.1 S49 family peptidase [Geminicoccaceae bacterium]
MRFLWRLFVGLLATLGLVVLLMVGGIAAGGWWIARHFEQRNALPNEIVLVADLRGGLDDAPADGLAGLGIGGWGLGLSDVVLALDRASRDSRVKGIVARLDDTSHGLAGAQELREAVGRFRDSGRFAVAFADSFGELGSGNEGYYLATAFERIRLQPVGLVGLTGLMAEVPFAKALLDRIGVVAAFGRREEYKTAFDTATEYGLTPANRAMLEQLLSSLSAQLVAGIAESRDMEEAAVRRLIDQGPFTAEEAVDNGLVDDLAHWDRVLDEAGSSRVDLDDYAATEDGPPADATAVAFVRATGPIVRGNGLAGRIGADDMADALSDAVDDPDIRAILFRIDSPGGSAVASETIAHQVERAIAAGKPVIVAMGNAAASGGYWIAMGATKIVAQPGTLTGSIGVLGGKPVLAGLWDHLDIDWAQLPAAANADIWSMNTPYSPSGKARLDHLLDDIYANFKQGVAEGRKLPPERVEEIAKGRVWAGSDALGIGLVDELGGLFEARQATRVALGLAEDAPLDLRPFPRPRTPFDRAMELLQSESGMLGRIASAVAALTESGIARMPALQVR